jgi:hypothetical protein
VDVSGVVVKGYGAVSPAGWGVGPFREALNRGEPLPEKTLGRPSLKRELRVRPVPAPSAKPAFLSHTRLRRTSPISQYAVAAGLEALGDDAPCHTSNLRRLGIIYCAMAGCVKYSQRFYDETLKDPSTASPLIFPETVFNAPASHLAALLGTNAINYTLVGDPGTFLQGVALAANWLLQKRVDGCLVIGAEELDWLVTEAFCLFDQTGIVSEGAGALYLARESERTGGLQLQAVTSPQVFSPQLSRAQAALRVRAELNGSGPDALLCDSCQGVPRLDRDETPGWRDWKGQRLSPKMICGEAFMAAAAWQCVAAVDALARGACSSATVSIVGSNEQAIAAEFIQNPLPARDHEALGANQTGQGSRI